LAVNTDKEIWGDDAAEFKYAFLEAYIIDTDL
jgi:hypothetical protein